MIPPDQEDHSVQLLKQGIQAARKGQKDNAQKLLLQVIDQDERNEAAWLWMSGVVDSDEDRLVCLENVLAINPNNGSAQKGLAKLRQMFGEVEQPEPEMVTQYETKLVEDEDVYRVERPPISAAAAVLYPERQIMEIPSQDSADLQTVPAVNYETKTGYDDVWEKETDLCAFCAHEVEFDETRCPNCKSKLIVSHFRYPNSGADLIVYFVLIIGTAQLYFVQALIDLIIEKPLIVVIWHIFLFVVLLGLSFAVALRQFWAYTASIVILLMIFLTMVLDVVFGLSAIELIETGQGLAYFEAIADVGAIAFFAPALELLGPFQMLGVALALLYGFFKAGPDFERVKLKRLARVDRGISDASMFYTTGKAYAKEKMWALAVLHFQRAAANEPNRPYYHLATGKAFAELGYKERARDALSSALRLTTDDKVKTEIQASIAAIQ